MTVSTSLQFRFVAQIHLCVRARVCLHHFFKCQIPVKAGCDPELTRWHKSTNGAPCSTQVNTVAMEAQ